MTKVTFTYITGEGILRGNTTVADNVWVRVCPTGWLIPHSASDSQIDGLEKFTHTKFGDF